VKEQGEVRKREGNGGSFRSLHRRKAHTHTYARCLGVLVIIDKEAREREEAEGRWTQPLRLH